MKLLFIILKHKWFVLIAGLRVGGIPFWRLLIHDWSKLSPAEFFTYRKRYVLNECPDEEWDRAWLHHVHHNPHHWQHWILDGKILYMPETYIREMVADFLGASRSYTGSWDIQPWLNSESHKFRLHPKSLMYLAKVLDEQMLVLPKR